MSTSPSYKKSRKDFGFANSLDASLSAQREEQRTVPPQEPVVQQEPVQEVQPLYNNINRGEVYEDVRPVARPAEPQAVYQSPRVDESVSELRRVLDETPSLEEVPVETKTDALDLLLSAKAPVKGVQKSVYLDGDVHQYIKEKCERSGAKYSVVLNLMLRKYIESQE